MTDPPAPWDEGWMMFLIKLSCTHWGWILPVAFVARSKMCPSWKVEFWNHKKVFRRLWPRLKWRCLPETWISYLMLHFKFENKSTSSIFPSVTSYVRPGLCSHCYADDVQVYISSKSITNWNQNSEINTSLSVPTSFLFIFLPLSVFQQIVFLNLIYFPALVTIKHKFIMKNQVTINSF